ncbi:MAG TPA: hypothetical protein DD473_24000 [Planctomycetaceae bacterium]|nr:hypothetical protein [Planctomycetaceae bacterium]
MRKANAAYRKSVLLISMETHGIAFDQTLSEGNVMKDQYRQVRVLIKVQRAHTFLLLASQCEVCEVSADCSPD